MIYRLESLHNQTFQVFLVLKSNSEYSLVNINLMTMMVLMYLLISLWFEATADPWFSFGRRGQWFKSYFPQLLSICRWGWWCQWCSFSLLFFFFFSAIGTGRRPPLPLPLGWAQSNDTQTSEHPHSAIELFRYSLGSALALIPIWLWCSFWHLLFSSFWH